MVRKLSLSLSLYLSVSLSLSLSLSLFLYFSPFLFLYFSIFLSLSPPPSLSLSLYLLKYFAILPNCCSLFLHLSLSYPPSLSLYPSNILSNSPHSLSPSPTSLSLVPTPISLSPSPSPPLSISLSLFHTHHTHSLSDIPYNDYYEYYCPDYSLHIQPSNMEDLNSKEYIEGVKLNLFQVLKDLPHAPSAPFVEVPRDRPDEEEEEGNPDERMSSM